MRRVSYWYIVVYRKIGIVSLYFKGLRARELRETPENTQKRGGEVECKFNGAARDARFGVSGTLSAGNTAIRA